MSATPSSKLQPIWARVSLDDLPRQAKAWVLEKDAQPVAALFLARDRFFEKELLIQFKLPQNAFWIFSAYVKKEHRRQGIYSKLLSGVISQPEYVGKTFFAAVNVANKPSVVAHQRASKRLVGTATAVRFLSFVVCWCKGGLMSSRLIGFGQGEQKIVIDLEETDCRELA